MALTNTRGIFSLIDVKLRQKTNYWSPPQYGYFGGGIAAARVSTVDRVDYSNDTSMASPRGPLSSVSQYLAATGNTSYGWFGGGDSPTIISTVGRIDYSNDTLTASPRGPLSVARTYLSATGNSSYGWFGGGGPGTPFGNSVVSIVDRIDYSNDTATASPRGPLIRSKYQEAATGNSSYGWFGGGNDGAGGLGPVSTVGRIDYSNDTVTVPARGILSAARDSLGATGNSSFGYFGGGSGASSRVDRIDYSNDTATAPARGPLSAGKLGLSATGDSSFGYFGGGNVPGASISTVDRIDYSNDTAIVSVRGPLSLARNYLTATSSTANGLSQVTTVSGPVYAFGYFGGGLTATPAYVSTVDRIDYSNDTATASAKGPLSIIVGYFAATGNSSYGWFGGGSSPGAPGTVASTVGRINYSNDTATASPRGPLSVARYNLAATGNSSYGWFGGGITSVNRVSTIDRIDYTNDTTTASPRGLLTDIRDNLTATGNSSFGYFGGGVGSVAPQPRSTVNRIDYSNDTATASTRGPLSVTRHLPGATGNSSFGYFGGGFTGTAYVSTIDRIDYSNDTATASPKGLLSAARGYLAATGNSSFGYFGGGITPVVSTVDRIDYSNDTVTAPAKGPLSAARYRSAASSAQANAVTNTTGPAPSLNYPFTSNLNLLNISSRTSSRPYKVNTPVETRPYGYFGGGNNVTPGIKFSTVDRIDYSNDTATAPAKGPLSASRTYFTATGNSSFGYFGGGVQDIGAVSLVERINYSNDTATALVRGPLSAAKDSLGAVSNSYYGYFGGASAIPGPISTIDRIDYSNDTATASPRGPLLYTVSYAAATGNNSYGYFGGGGPGAPLGGFSIVSRIDYSNDNGTALIRGPLSIIRIITAATGNSSFGYFGGGSLSPGSPIYSTVDRIDYSNDTATASPKGPLSAAKRMVAATGNSSFGYFGGGNTATTISTVDRINYSNDTATASPRGPLSSARAGVAATSPYANALPQ